MKESIDLSIHLLDYIAHSTGCTYVSDLHQRMMRPYIYEVLCNIEPCRFSVSEWMDAVNYITGEIKLFDNQSKAAEFLINYCRRATP